MAPATVIVRVAGGRSGTRLAGARARVDLRVRAPALVLLGLVSGRLPARQALRGGRVLLEGDRAALEDLPRLFDVPSAFQSEPGGMRS